jgi:Pyruvate/2-oxoacid:ferredoxin oxidoreductase delta subunit
MAAYDVSLQLTATPRSFTWAERIGLSFAGGGVLLLLVALSGASGAGPAKFFLSGLGLLLSGLFIFYGYRLHAPTTRLTRQQKWGLGVFGAGLLASLLALSGWGQALPTLFFWLGPGLVIAGGLVYIWNTYGQGLAGIRNNGLMLSATTARGAIGWMLGLVLTGFYVLLYWFPETLEGLIRLLDPLSWLLRGKAADQWFMYGSFYTFAVLTMGVRAMLKYRHSRYQVIRTGSVMFFQLGFAWLIPSLLVLFNQPEFYFSYFWPLKYSYLWPSDFQWLMNAPGGLGTFMLFWGAVMSFIATPVLTYFFGKRWYCSWVCGCGGLAETLGDPWRHLSDKSLRAWQVERWLIHSVLVFVVVTTAALWINAASGGALLGDLSGTFSKSYGFLIGMVFSGVIGTGFYPIMGSRVWCRFGCPMAAILGLFQKYFSRFRITTNGGQCISCGNCSTYCEMGIDVRWYAQRGQNIIRSSCVGCGVCSAVCPRGVLSLENGPRQGRYNGPILLDRDLTVLTED